MQALRQLRPVPKFMPRPQGKTIGFLSPKGGCGTSTILSHVAAELGRGGDAVAVVDLDFNGTVGFLMKAYPSSSITDDTSGEDVLDLRSWNTSPCGLAAGVDLYEPLGFMELNDVSQVRRLLAFVEAKYDWSLIDLGRGLSPLISAVLQEIGEVYLVSTLDVPAMHQARRIVSTLLETGYHQNRIRLVVNRAPKRLEVTTTELERMFGIPIDYLIPNAYPELYYAYADGKLLDRNTQLASQLSRFAANLSAQ